MADRDHQTLRTTSRVRPLRALAPLIAGTVALISACAPAGSESAKNAPPLLRDVSTPGRIEAMDLTEASGLAQSARDSRVFWSFGDSGNEPQLFAFDSTGRSLGTVKVTGATNRDWEAIAVGPCARGACLYIGDVGDNYARREHVTIWRIGEPQPTDRSSEQAQALHVAYADGARDVEAIWVAPDTTVFLITKRPERDAERWRAARVYRVNASAWRDTGVVTAEIVDSLPIVPRKGKAGGWITDASLSIADAQGDRRLAVRTYNSVYIFAADGRSGRPGALLARCSLKSLPERDSGEGLTWLTDGRLLFDHEGVRASLHAARCP